MAYRFPTQFVFLFPEDPDDQELEGIAKKSGTDQYDNHWIEYEVDIGTRDLPDEWWELLPEELREKFSDDDWFHKDPEDYISELEDSGWWMDECSICGRKIESGWLCMDGGDVVCDDHVFDMTVVDPENGGIRDLVWRLCKALEEVKGLSPLTVLLLHDLSNERKDVKAYTVLYDVLDENPALHDAVIGGLGMVGNLRYTMEQELGKIFDAVLTHIFDLPNKEENSVETKTEEG